MTAALQRALGQLEIAHDALRKVGLEVYAMKPETAFACGRLEGQIERTLRFIRIDIADADAEKGNPDVPLST